MKTSDGCRLPLALLALSLTLAMVVAERHTALEADKTEVMLSRVDVASRRNASAISVDKVLRTYAEHLGMLKAQFDGEFDDVIDLYNQHCCPHEKLPPQLPPGGRDVSLFIADYSNLPSLAVLVTPNDAVKAKLAVVYGKGSTIGAPIFGLLNSVHDKFVQPNLKLVMNDEQREVGIFQVPDEENRVQVYLTTSGLQHAGAFDMFKVLGKLDISEFKQQARLLGNTVTNHGGHFWFEPGIFKMLDLPHASLVVADPSVLRSREGPIHRSLAILYHNKAVYPAMVSWAEYDADHNADHKWKVFVRYLTSPEFTSLQVLDAEITCAMFGPDLERVLAPVPPKDELTHEFEKLLKSKKYEDPVKLAVEAANNREMPKLEIPEGFFDTKVKTLPFDDEQNLYVLYHHAQRNYAYQHKRIFEHVFGGARDRTMAVHFPTFNSLMKEINPPAAMTFLLSEKRFAMGWPADGVEVGAGHNCLIQDEQEKVYIAGEVLFADDGVSFNFNSGTFTRQIAPLYYAGVAAHETQWLGLIKKLISTMWDSQVNKINKADVPSPEVTYTTQVLIPFTPPKDYTKQAFCRTEPWMQTCACIEDRGRYINYCDVLPAIEGKVRGEIVVRMCNHDFCHPP